MTMPRRASMILAGALALVLGLAARPPHAAEPPSCNMRLAVQLTPDVPNPRAESFLSSLVGAPGYQLIWRGQHAEDSVTEFELTGPGPDYRCEQVVDVMRKDARVMSIRVQDQSQQTD